MGVPSESIVIRWLKSLSTEELEFDYAKLRDTFRRRVPVEGTLENWPDRVAFSLRGSCREHVGSILAPSSGAAFSESWIIQIVNSVFARLSLRLHLHYSASSDGIERCALADEAFLESLLQGGAADIIARDPRASVKGTRLALYFYFKAERLNFLNDDLDHPVTITPTLFNECESLLATSVDGGGKMHEVIEVLTTKAAISEFSVPIDQRCEALGNRFAALLKTYGIDSRCWLQR